MTVEQMAQAKIGELMIANMKMLNALGLAHQEIARLNAVAKDAAEPQLPLSGAGGGNGGDKTLDVEGAGASGTASGPPNGTTCGNGIVGGSGGRLATSGGTGGGAG